MTIAPPEPQTAGTRVAQGGGIRFVENPDTGVREVEARICCYGVGPDTYGSTWRQGWAGDSIREAQATGRPIPVVFGHDERNLANIVGSVAGFDDRPDGLYVRMRMANFDEVPSARVAYSLIRDGHLPGWSYKFADAKFEPDPQHRGVIQYTRGRLVHVSPVIDPSVPGTATVGVRSETSKEDEMDLDALSSTISAAVRDGIAEGLRSAGVGQQQADEPPPSPQDLALSIAGALTAACAMFDARSADLDGFGDLGAVLTAGAVAADELCDALGVDATQVRSAAEHAATAAVGESGQREHVGFQRLEHVLAAKGAADPAALAAYIGRKKYGRAGMAALAEKGRLKKSTHRDTGDGDDEIETALQALGIAQSELDEALQADVADMGGVPEQRSADEPVDDLAEELARAQAILARR